MGLLLRWSHSCLFVECPYFIPHLSSCPQRPLSLSLSLLSPLLPAFIPIFTSPQGVLAPLHLRKKSDAFCDFSSWFFSSLRYCAGMHDGNWEGNYFLPQFNFIILWTNSSRGLGKGEGMEGEGENRAPIFFWLLFYLTFKDHYIQTCWRQSSSAGCCSHSDGLDFSQDEEQLEGPND